MVGAGPARHGPGRRGPRAGRQWRHGRLIVGIYEELLTTIGGLGLGTVRDLFRDGPVATWRRYNLGFLAALGAGIVTAVALLAGLLHHLLAEHPVLLWSFFFGLVAASVPLMLREIPRSDRGAAAGVALLVGAGIAWWLTGLPPLVQSDAPLFLFVSGAIAICAMILPGISGSFILVLLGAYSAVIGALKGLDLVRIAAFAGGALGGLLGFSKGLGWVFRRHRALALALLSGASSAPCASSAWKEQAVAPFRWPAGIPAGQRVPRSPPRPPVGDGRPLRWGRSGPRHRAVPPRPTPGPWVTGFGTSA